MGKYKNNIVVRGPKSLLKAFTQELDELGYEFSESLVPGKDLYVYGWNGSEEYPEQYSYRESFNSVENYYSLPEQWNEALVAASEPYEENWKVGDWLKFTAGEQPLYRVYNVDTSCYYFEWWHNNERKTGHLNHKVGYCRLATKEEIYEYLVKVATEMYGGNPVISLRTHTYDGENWGSAFTSSTSCGSNVRLFEFTYDENFDSLSTRGAGLAIVYEKGKWAEKSILLPKIEGYSGNFVGDRVVYGCKSFHKEEVKKLYASIKHFNQNINGKITSVALDDEYIIRFSDLEQIVNTL